VIRTPSPGTARRGAGPCHPGGGVRSSIYRYDRCLR
jgi:hypothetical protein